MGQYKWKISILEQVKHFYLSLEDITEEERTEALELISEMFLLMEGKTPKEEVCRIKNIVYNCCYYLIMGPKQLSNFRILREKMLSISKNSVKYHKFDINDILGLLEEFIDWCPSNEIKQMLQYYYRNCFSSHFYYSQGRKIYPVRGYTYEFASFYPFVIVEKNTFIETFLTLAHELGHVISGMQRMNNAIGFGHPFLREMDGKYFELLAFKFLIHKQFGIQEGFDSAISDYRGVRCCVLDMQFPRLLKKSLIAEEYLTEIYSYLGALELLNRYHEDYEKQLADLFSLPIVTDISIIQYLKKADFHFLENQFEVLVKHRKWLQKNK